MRYKLGAEDVLGFSTKALKKTSVSKYVGHGLHIMQLLHLIRSERTLGSGNVYESFVVYLLEEGGVSMAMSLDSS